MIVQVGPYPPPYGGISIYIKRMKEYLDSVNIKNQVWNTGRSEKQVKNVIYVNLKTLPARYFFKNNIDLIHYNICGTKSKYYIGMFNKLLFNKRKKIISLHGDSREMFAAGNTLLAAALNSFEAVICVREGDREILLENGVTAGIYEIPAFIPPGREPGNHLLPEYLNSFLKNHRFIISANGSSLIFRNGEDLYGTDMLVMLAARLLKLYPNKGIGFVFGLSDIGDIPYYEKLKRIIADNRIEKDFIFVNEKIEFHPIISKSSLFIRPTNTDGYSISLAEAIHYKVPSIASDSVKRPKDVTLFKTRDMDDLYMKTISVMEHYDFYRSLANNAVIEDNAGKIINVYREVTGMKL